MAIGAALSLAACVTGNSYPIARTPLERSEAAYARIRNTADALLPALPIHTARRVRMGLAIADTALAIARGGRPSERERALRDLAASVASILLALPAR